MDDAVCYHEGGDIFLEDIDNKMAVLPEKIPQRKLTIDDTRVDDPHATPEERAGTALPPAAYEAICGIDVTTAKPLAILLKGLLSPKIITNSTSPWASPIVVIINANGVDIRLCIDYEVVNILTRLTVYPMSLINDLLEDLDNAL
ncbi:LOW QUALITY PROTEIN: reverse transcriptase, partial [Phytophthora megakarya]